MRGANDKAAIAPSASEWDFASVVELAAALRSRKLSASELLEHTVARVEALDQRFNAVVVRDFDRARTRLKLPMRRWPAASSDRCSVFP